MGSVKEDVRGRERLEDAAAGGCENNAQHDEASGARSVPWVGYGERGYEGNTQAG